MRNLEKCVTFTKERRTTRLSVMSRYRHTRSFVRSLTHWNRLNSQKLDEMWSDLVYRVRKSFSVICVLSHHVRFGSFSFLWFVLQVKVRVDAFNYEADKRFGGQHFSAVAFVSLARFFLRYCHCSPFSPPFRPFLCVASLQVHSLRTVIVRFLSFVNCCFNVHR